MSSSRDSIERVKTAALATGLRVSQSLLDDLGGPERLTIHEYATTGGVTLELPGGVLVNAPFDEPACATTPLRLDRADGELVLVLGEDRVPVHRILPLPGYLAATDGAGRRITETVMSHTDRVRVSPIVGCVYDCHFCDLGTMRYRPRDVEQIVTALDVAMADTAVLPARHVLISGGSPARKHEAYFESTCAEILAHVKQSDPACDVDIMMSPREGGSAFVERLVAAGIDGFSFNIELFDEGAAMEHLPLKHRWSRPHLESMIVAGVHALGWGTGRVRSLIIVGLEPVELTLRGIEWLAERGCHPVISPFRPAVGTVLAGAAPASVEDLTYVLREARRIVAAHDLTLGPHCLPCQHNTLTFPWDVPDELVR